MRGSAIDPIDDYINATNAPLDIMLDALNHHSMFVSTEIGPEAEDGDVRERG